MDIFEKARAFATAAHHDAAQVRMCGNSVCPPVAAALVRANHGQSRQGMIHMRNCKSIPPGRRLAAAVCDIPHRWVIYVAAFCSTQAGERYIKSQEIALQGIYLAAHLTDVIETYYRETVSSCNRTHLVGSGWIANPCGEDLTEEQAARLFDAAGAWQQQPAEQEAA